MRSALAGVCLVACGAWLPAIFAAPAPDVKVGPAPRAAIAPGDPTFQFTDVTAAAGIRFKHTSGAFGKKYLPETLGSGVAFLTTTTTAGRTCSSSTR